MDRFRFKYKKINFSTLLIVILWSMFGCHENSTLYESQILIEDQIFSLSEKSEEGALVGQISASGSDNKELSFYLVQNEYSINFMLEDRTGKLYLKIPSSICYDLVQEMNLEVMVGYKGTSREFGVFAHVKILIIDEKLSFFWESDPSGAINQDAMVNSALPDENFAQSFYSFGSAWTVNLQPSVIRTFLQFDLSNIPPDAELVNAYLDLYSPDDGNPDHTHSKFSGSNAFYIRKVVADWNSQTITWANMPSYSEDSEILAPLSDSENQNYTIDVSEIVKSMIKNPDSNFGFVIMLENENYYRRVCFASMDNPEEQLCPKIRINYLY